MRQEREVQVAAAVAEERVAIEQRFVEKQEKERSKEQDLQVCVYNAWEGCEKSGCMFQSARVL